jgi:hypothetical protein
MKHRIEHIIEDGFEKKWCKKCNLFKVCNGDNRNFANDKSTWDGLRWICKTCDSAQCKKWSERNSEAIKRYKKEWRKINGKERDKKDYQKRKNNPQHMEYNKNYRREWCKRQRIENPAYKLKQNVSRRIRELLQKGGKSQTTVKYVGCTIEKLMCHLEKQFDEYMTWENQGKWHIDHIIPCNAFDTSNVAEATAMWHYSNLQPMWGKENILKSDHYDEENKKQYMREWRELCF